MIDGFLKGYDESSYQGDTFPGDADFGILKSTEGGKWTDPTQGAKAQWLRSRMLPVLMYHFGLGVASGYSIEAQVDHFISACVSLEGDGLVLDWENSTHPMTQAERDQFGELLLQKRPTHMRILYCNLDWWRTRDNENGDMPQAFDGLWIAEYNNHPGHPDITHPWILHQYTSTPLDTNVANFSTRAAFFAYLRSRMNSPAPAPQPAPAPVAPPTPPAPPAPVVYWASFSDAEVPGAVYRITEGKATWISPSDYVAAGEPHVVVLTKAHPLWAYVVSSGVEYHAPVVPAPVAAPPVPTPPPAPQPEPAPIVVPEPPTPPTHLTPAPGGTPVPVMTPAPKPPVEHKPLPVIPDPKMSVWEWIVRLIQEIF